MPSASSGFPSTLTSCHIVHSQFSSVWTFYSDILEYFRWGMLNRWGVCITNVCMWAEKVKLSCKRPWRLPHFLGIRLKMAVRCDSPQMKNDCYLSSRRHVVETSRPESHGDRLSCEMFPSVFSSLGEVPEWQLKLVHGPFLAHLCLFISYNKVSWLISGVLASWRYSTVDKGL
jgi:hypothetical protein